MTLLIYYLFIYIIKIITLIIYIIKIAKIVANPVGIPKIPGYQDTGDTIFTSNYVPIVCLHTRTR